MPLDLDTLASGRLGLAVAMGVGRAVPRALGRRLADAVASGIGGRTGSSLVRAVRANQWVVSGCSAAGAELDALTLDALRTTARGLYDLYHLSRGERELGGLVEIDESMASWMSRMAEGESVVVAAPHLAGFDVVLRRLARDGLRAQALTIADPGGAYRVENEMRASAGLEVTPVSTASLRTAAARLRQGGSVMTALDRPLTRGGAVLGFFGRPARLPDLHARLAARSGVPLVAMWPLARVDGGYVVRADEVRRSPDRDDRAAPDEARVLAENLLRMAEDVIRTRPARWSMPHAVWPEAVAELAALEAGSRPLAPGDDAQVTGRSAS